MPSNEQQQRALRLLGLAARAGRVISGVPLICTALQKNAAGKKVRLVLSASDASDNTKKRIADRTAYYGVRHIPLSVDCATLAHTVGKRDGAVAAVGITEPGLATAIGELYE